MDWIITTAVFLSGLNASLCFNIDPVAWKTLTQPAAGFGYQVVQRKSDLLVSAPLAQYSPRGRGQIYKCSTESCKQLSVPVPEFAVNMSLGLTMASDPSTQTTLACGPTIPKDCKSITLYSGACWQIDGSDGVTGPVPSSNGVCRSADITFLLDGSGSVKALEFQTMKTFVKNLVRSLLPADTKFAIVQFSTSPEVHFYFSDNLTSGTASWEQKVDDIRRRGGSTYTAKAITSVVNDVFTPTKGSRPNVRKVLIVITDGQSNDRTALSSATSLADNKKIVRFAIGVGNAFNNDDAINELYTIASTRENVFQVESFDALDKIRQTLQAKLFSIEGSQTSGESLKLEMAQEGFSAAYVPQGIQMAIVGANEWKGGFLQYSSTGLKTSSYEAEIETDSYLGYSIAVAKTRSRTLTIVGAPRYQHRGAVMVVYRNKLSKTIDPFPWQFQSGEYFGAVVCAMDVNLDNVTDLILISAPMFMDSDREGRVYVCSLTGLDVECHLDSPSVLRGDVSDKGRFGSSLAVLPDLNTDGLSDLAVGAPLENDGQGSIYIFHGEGGVGGISSSYSQRIAASEVRSPLRFFGLSISQSSFDHSGDGLPDLAIGSKGAVVLLRSKPIVMVEATVSFSPNQIPTQNPDCSKPLESTAEICFTMTRHSKVDEVRARISYNLTLDATRKVPNNRAYINGKQRETKGTVDIGLNRRVCNTVTYFVQACPEDALNALSNELRFAFEGLPIPPNPSPSLAQQAQKTTVHPLGFEINCGNDNKCVDDLKVDFNFTKSLEVKVGIDELLDVTVSVENRGENSYNSRVLLTYPTGLSFRKFTTQQGRIECSSLDSEDGVTRGKTDCTVDKPILKSNSKAFFIISYGIETGSQLARSISFSANVTSGNREHSSSSELYRNKDIGVKYSIFATIESSLSYSNFSFGKNNLHKPVRQSIVVTNDIRAVNFTVVIRVPVKLGDKDIWADSSSLQISECQRGLDEPPKDTDFIAKIQKNKLVDCSVATCKVFKCSKLMGRLESKTYQISANLSSEWIEQIGLQSAKFLLISTASLEYDREQYIFFSVGSYNNPHVHKIEAEVEVYAEPDFTKEIVGGLLGGLALLALLTAGLYKAGFFKSKYKEMINDNAANPGDGGDALTPD